MGNISPQDAPAIFEYQDYRAYLVKFFATRKACDEEFSLRSFARRPELALSSSSFISAVVKGRKNLSQNLRLRFGRAMGLKAAEMEYFELLVQCNQSKSVEEKRHFQAQLARIHGSRARLLGETHKRFYARWYYSAVWHFFGLHQNQASPAQIARTLSPPVAPQQVEEAIRTLLDLKLIKKLANGYAVADRHVAAGSALRGARMRGHQGEFMRLAAENLDGLPASERNFTVTTFSISGEGIERIKRRIEALRAEVRELVEADAGAEREAEDRVYALALQLFPFGPAADPTRTHQAKPGRPPGRRQSGTTSDSGNPED